MNLEFSKISISYTDGVGREIENHSKIRYFFTKKSYVWTECNNLVFESCGKTGLSSFFSKEMETIVNSHTIKIKGVAAL